MVIDGDEVEASALPHYDVVVVGTGIAGQTLLQMLMPSGLRVALIESGSYVQSPRTDALKKVRTPRRAVGDESRERYLGGTANTWGKGCVKLDDIDMEARTWAPASGWPLSRAELEPYYQSACRLLDIIDADAISAPEGGYLFDGNGLTTRFVLYTRRFAGFDDELLRAIRDQGNVDLLLNSNVVDLELGEHGHRVERLRVKTLAGSAFVVEGDVFVLACGGIENSRLLLMSSTATGRGVGNAYDNVGRYFMEHPKEVLGFIRPAERQSEVWPYTKCTIDGQSLRGGISVTEDVQRTEQVLHSHARLIVERKWERNAGVRALSALRRGTSIPTETADDPEDFPADEKSKLKLAFSLIANLPQIAMFATYRLLRRPRPIHRIWLKNHLEMEPHRENRVHLDDETDELGCPRAVVDYAPTELDRRSIVVLHQLIADHVAKSGSGALESPLLSSAERWDITRDAAHHMGGTRMGLDPRTSVVDADCKVHTVDNLYVSGSSVFPSAGYANPTMTIVALSIRLAEHLCQRLIVDD